MNKFKLGDQIICHDDIYITFAIVTSIIIEQTVEGSHAIQYKLSSMASLHLGSGKWATQQEQLFEKEACEQRYRHVTDLDYALVGAKNYDEVLAKTVMHFIPPYPLNWINVTLTTI